MLRAGLPQMDTCFLLVTGPQLEKEMFSPKAHLNIPARGQLFRALQRIASVTG